MLTDASRCLGGRINSSGNSDGNSAVSSLFGENNKASHEIVRGESFVVTVDQDVKLKPRLENLTLENKINSVPHVVYLKDQVQTKLIII